MSYSFVKINPAVATSVVDFGSLGFSVGQQVNVIRAGAFGYTLGGSEVGDFTLLSYGGVTYGKSATFTLTALEGLSATAETFDSVLDDNADTNADYGYYIGAPDVEGAPNPEGAFIFPGDGRAHIVSSSTAPLTLDARATGTALDIDLFQGGISFDRATGSSVILPSGATTTLSGSGGDRIFAPLLTSYIDAGAGFDALVMPEFLSNIEVVYASSGAAVIRGSTGTITIRNFEQITLYDGTIDLSGSLINDLFYYDRNPDVLQAGVPAAQHYEASGWREGRDPNALFSTNGYLAANADVRAAGVNPLTHYDQFGWKEGRDPSAYFDNELYLKNNPDVAAAGVDPLLHYLQNGQSEGRQAYAAVGNAVDLGARSGFDAEYYLLANADVSAVALISGENTGDFAYRHYEQFGWREGRNPNAQFDVQGYLTAYGDVAAAGVDPLLHYHEHGWKEGRDPSAGFDTSSYLAAYGDVAAAGIDPLLHYLQNGALEGRANFSDGTFGSGANG